MLKDFFSTSRGYGAEKLTKASSGLLMFLFIMVALLTGYNGQLSIRGPMELDVKHQTQVSMGQTWTSQNKGAELQSGWTKREGTFGKMLQMCPWSFLLRDASSELPDAPGLSAGWVLGMAKWRDTGQVLAA